MRVEHTIAGSHGPIHQDHPRVPTAGPVAPSSSPAPDPATPAKPAERRPYRSIIDSEPAVDPGAGQVQLADRVIPVAALRQDPDRYVVLFGRARHEVGHAVCLCRTDQVVRLVIRLRAGRYHLATWPAGGHQHAPGCTWYRSPDSMSGRSACGDAITIGPTSTSIRLSEPLTITGTAAVAEASAPARASADPSPAHRRTIGLLGLLHWLWESAQLNVRRPSEDRPWRTCWSQLDEQARDCRVNQRQLSDTMWIVPAFQPERAAEINAAWDQHLANLTSTPNQIRRGLVLGELRAVAPTRYGTRIHLAHQRASLDATADLMERARRSFPHVFSQRAVQPRCRQIVLCLVERTHRGYASVVQLAAMLTTSTYLPADSSHEVQMADALAEAGRAFVKPLNYDGDEVFADFVLVDDEPETYVEVWGVQGRARYEARKRAKQRIYRESGRRLIGWDVRNPIPELRRRTTSE